MDTGSSESLWRHKNFFLVKLTICLNLFTHGGVYLSLYFSLCHAVGFHQMPYDSFFFLPFIVDNKSLLLGARPWVPLELVVCLPPETLPLPRKLLEALGTILKGASYSRAPDSEGPLKVRIRMPTLLLKAQGRSFRLFKEPSRLPGVLQSLLTLRVLRLCCGQLAGPRASVGPPIFSPRPKSSWCPPSPVPKLPWASHVATGAFLSLCSGLHLLSSWTSFRNYLEWNLLFSNYSSWQEGKPGLTFRRHGTFFFFLTSNNCIKGFPDSSVGKESFCNGGEPGSIPELGRSAGEGIVYPLQYSWTSLVA